LNAAAGDGFRVVDEPDRQRYEAWLGDALVGFVEYRSVRGRRILFHTEVDPSVAGQGIGGRLVTGVLDDIRTQGMRITVKCPFVTAFLERHPTYRDLLAGPPATASPERSA
jgi:predicted GNAT family acetyltransferase